MKLGVLHREKARPLPGRQLRHPDPVLARRCLVAPVQLSRAGAAEEQRARRESSPWATPNRTRPDPAAGPNPGVTDTARQPRARPSPRLNSAPPSGSSSSSRRASRRWSTHPGSSAPTPARPSRSGRSPARRRRRGPRPGPQPPTIFGESGTTRSSGAVRDAARSVRTAPATAPRRPPRCTARLRAGGATDRWSNAA